MKFQSGQLREIVTIQSSTDTSDSYGEPIPRWVPVGNIPAKVVPKGAAEQFSAQQIESTVTHDVITRYRQDIDTTKRFKWGTRVLNITKTFDPDSRRQWLVCECIEDVD